MPPCSKRLGCQPSSWTLRWKSCSAAASSSSWIVRCAAMLNEFRRLYEDRRPCYLKAAVAHRNRGQRRGRGSGGSDRQPAASIAAQWRAHRSRLNLGDRAFRRSANVKVRTAAGWLGSRGSCWSRRPWRSQQDAKDKEPADQSVDAGSFGVFMNGRRVATEKFSIQQNTAGQRCHFRIQDRAGH